MKGVINKGIQELIEGRFGADAWAEIKSRAQCAEPFFAISEDYPDELTVALAGAASETLGIPVDTLLVEFGKFWVPNTGRDSYPTFYQLAGKTAREFLLNMNRVHEQVTRNAPSATPPVFTYEEVPDGTLCMHYHSQRGLCPVLRGLILGVGELFEEPLEVVETACAREGAPHCVMEVRFQ
ncbi:MAG: heme NO-binding domain-containing protein [Candidatus Eisenbacteria sp.]|nr:heme NO-binding domain-containing protein [Candidatus Eisenbacteria bacterium]